MELVSWLLMLLEGALGVMGSVLMAELRKVWPWLDAARDWVRYAIAWLIAVALVVGTCLALMWLGEMPVPETSQGWATTLFPYAFAAVTASQAYFNARKA